jgi:glycosyltransferase involved in cell wall biosynthesis
MKVSISILGRFHFFDLAKQLEKKKYLKQLITSYPKFKAKEWGISKAHVDSLLFIEVIIRVLRRTWFFNSNLNIKIKKIYGFLSSAILQKNIDVFIFFAGNGFNSKIVGKLKEKGILCVADEGSSHILNQIKILDNEYKNLGVKYRINRHPDLIKETLLEYELANYIVVPSSFVKRSFIEQGISEEKLFVNHYGVDLSQFKQIQKKDEVFRVIYCGRLSIPKGSHYLLQAIFELNLENFELWHIGGVQDEMKPYIEKYKSSKIILKGVYDQSNLYKLYSQGSVFCIPSLQEGMALVQLQAMSCGLPLICTTNTGGDDLITINGKEGFVIPICDVEAIKQKLVFLYNNKEICKEMGIAAKKKVGEGYTWDDYGKRYVNFLDKVSGNY